MYDGGEADLEQPHDEERPAEELPNEAAEDTSGGKIQIDMDKWEGLPGGMAKISRTRLKRVKDWRIKKIHWSKALIERQLRPNDLNLIYSLVGAFVFWVGMTIAMMLTLVDKATGLVYSIPFPYVAVCMLITASVIYQSRTFVTKELVYWGLINAAYMICGIIYFVYEFELKEFSIQNIGSDDETSLATVKQ